MFFGEKLANLRKENNLTQEQLAALLKVSRQAISKWESNITFPETEKLIKISQLFSCSLDYLLKDEMERTDSDCGQKNAKNDYLMGLVYTFLSFPPFCGFVIGIFSLLHQKKTLHSKPMIVFSIIGIMVSVCLTALMFLGAIFGL